MYCGYRSKQTEKAVANHRRTERRRHISNPNKSGIYNFGRGQLPSMQGIAVSYFTAMTYKLFVEIGFLQSMDELYIRPVT